MRPGIAPSLGIRRYHRSAPEPDKNGTIDPSNRSPYMAMPNDIPIIDCMIGFPANDFSQYEFIRKQLRDTESRE